MEVIFLFKFVHLLGASVLFGTGLGIVAGCGEGAPYGRRRRRRA